MSARHGRDRSPTAALADAAGAREVVEGRQRATSAARLARGGRHRPRGDREVIDLLLNATGLGGGGSIDVDLSSLLPPLTVPLPFSLGNLTLARRVRLDGLDTIDSIHLIDPPSNDSAHAPRDEAAS